MSKVTVSNPAFDLQGIRDINNVFEIDATLVAVCYGGFSKVKFCIALSEEEGGGNKLVKNVVYAPPNFVA